MGTRNPAVERFTQKPTKFQSPAGAATDRELRDKLYGLFMGMHSLGMDSVRRAYLSGVHYDGVQEPRLAVCLIAEKTHAEKTVGAIAKVFGNIDAKGQLDILFVSEEQEKQVKESCEAFFSA